MINELIKNKEVDGIVTIDSREVAEMMGRSHSDIMKMIQGSGKNLGIIPVLEKGNFHVSDYFIESTYKVDGNNKTYNCYLVTKMGCEMLGNKLQGENGILFSASYVRRFNQMEEALKEKTQPKLPTTYKEALLELVAKIEENEKLEEENRHLVGEIEHKEDVIIGLVTDIDLAEKRQRISQIVRHGTKRYSERYNLLYSEFNKKYHTDVKRRLDNAKARGEVKKSANVMAYICDVMNMTAELYELSCKLFENDVKELMEEMWDIAS